MLILGRKAGDAVVFGNHREGFLEVQQVSGGMVTMVINTPNGDVSFTGGRGSSVTVTGIDGCRWAKIIIVDIDGRQARVGFDLPKSVHVVRHELYSEAAK